MIKLREFREDDIMPIDSIFRRQPSLGVPSLNNLICNGTLVDGDKIIGYGAVKLFIELILILDKSIRKRERAQALDEAMRNAIIQSKDAGVEQLYAIASDPNFSRVLQNRYKFKVVPGELLMLDIS